tara:strand:+ start:672 stop:992 length:321 start_codon:yes stop_codon:yes gene_type:complete
VNVILILEGEVLLNVLALHHIAVAIIVVLFLVLQNVGGELIAQMANVAVMVYVQRIVPVLSLLFPVQMAMIVLKANVVVQDGVEGVLAQNHQKNVLKQGIVNKLME